MKIKDDGICPVTNKHCYDECCPTGAECNMQNTSIMDEEIKLAKGWRQIIKEQKEDPNYVEPTPLTMEELFTRLEELYKNRYKDNSPKVYNPYAPKYNDGDTTVGDPNFGKSITT